MGERSSGEGLWEKVSQRRLRRRSDRRRLAMKARAEEADGRRSFGEGLQEKVSRRRLR
jgi:hypothetical protein